MAFLRSSLTLAERFLDGLDKKEEGTINTTAVSLDAPAFVRRSASSSSQNLVDSSAPLTPTLKGPLSSAQSIGGQSDVSADSRRHDGPLVTIRSASELGTVVETVDTLGASPAASAFTHNFEGDGDTTAALLHAVQEKDARIIQITVQNEELRRHTRDLEADLNDAENQLRAALADRDRAKKNESSLEQQIKEAYAEVCACACT